MASSPDLPARGRLLGLDYGEKRVGVAVSDPTRTIASSRAAIAYRRIDELVERISAVIDAEAADGPIVGVVLGDPRHMSGDPSGGTRAVERLRELLARRLGLPVRLWDERWSSVEAETLLAKRGVPSHERRRRVDSVAAAVILQGFLESLREPPPAGREQGENGW